MSPDSLSALQSTSLSPTVWPCINTFLSLDDGVKKIGGAFPFFVHGGEDAVKDTAQVMEYLGAPLAVQTSKRKSLYPSLAALMSSTKSNCNAHHIRTTVAVTLRRGMPSPVKL